MFKWIKNLFCKPCEQYYSVVHIVYEFEKEEPEKSYYVLKPRKKNKKKGKK